MEVNISRIIISVINFAILYFILKHYLFNPVNSVIESREKGIAEKIDRANEDALAAERMRLERENSLKLLEIEGKKIIESYRFKAEELSDEIITEAKEEAQHAMERARTEIHLEQEKAKEELKAEVIGLALAFAERALAESLDETIHRKLITDFIVKVDK